MYYSGSEVGEEACGARTLEALVQFVAFPPGCDDEDDRGHTAPPVAGAKDHELKGEHEEQLTLEFMQTFLDRWQADPLDGDRQGEARRPFVRGGLTSPGNPVPIGSCSYLSASSSMWGWAVAP